MRASVNPTVSSGLRTPSVVYPRSAVVSASGTAIPATETVHIPALLKTKNPAVARVGSIVLVVTDLEGHSRSLIFFILSERAYATSYS